MNFPTFISILIRQRQDHRKTSSQTWRADNIHLAAMGAD
jgi:hypothetical protein